MRDPRELIKDVDSLPTLPTVVAKINELVDSPKSSAGELNRVISSDLALSSRILKLANSTFYGFSRKINSITHAVVNIGLNAVRNVAISAFVFEAFDARDLPFGYRDFWIHSIGVAVASQTLARRRGLKDTEEGFMCGLLHDCGKVALHQFAKRDYAAVLEKVAEDDCLIVDAELDVLDTTHAQVGGMLTEEWRLPEKMVDVITNHHLPAETDFPELCSCVHAADVLVRAMMIGSPGDARIPRMNGWAWKKLRFPVGSVAELMKAIAVEMRRVDAFIQMI